MARRGRKTTERRQGVQGWGMTGEEGAREESAERWVHRTGIQRFEVLHMGMQ